MNKKLDYLKLTKIRVGKPIKISINQQLRSQCQCEHQNRKPQRENNFLSTNRFLTLTKESRAEIHTKRTTRFFRSISCFSATKTTIQI